MSTNHIDTVRQHLLDQMQALREAKPEDVQRELDRARGISELAQVAVNTAKVEVDYLKVTNQPSAPFLEAPPDEPYRNGQQLPNGITGITRHKLQG
jgi:hypothetical protein